MKVGGVECLGAMDGEHGSTSAGDCAECRAEIDRLRSLLAQADSRNRTLLHVARYRVRSALAIVRSIARRTVRNWQSSEDFQAHLDARLGAIARSQEIMLRDVGESLSLRELLSDEFLAHAAHEGKQFSLDGPFLRLGFSVASTLSLAIHELAANAVKYGALSAEHGHVTVSWRIEQADAYGLSGHVIRIDWSETGMLLNVNAIRYSGFGLELIERTLPYDLGAITSLSFRPQGIQCSIILPAAQEAVMDDPAQF